MLMLIPIAYIAHCHELIIILYLMFSERTEGVFAGRSEENVGVLALVATHALHGRVRCVDIRAPRVNRRDGNIVLRQQLQRSNPLHCHLNRRCYLKPTQYQ